MDWFLYDRDFRHERVKSWPRTVMRPNYQNNGGAWELINIAKGSSRNLISSIMEI